MAGLDLGAGDGGGFPVRAQLQRLFGFIEGAQVVARIGRRLGHGEVCFGQAVVGGCQLVDQALHGLLVADSGQHAVQVHQVGAGVRLVLVKQLGELRRQVVQAVGEDEQGGLGLLRLG